MLKALNKTITAFALGATVLGGIAATPAFAQHHDRGHDRRDDRRDDRRYDRRAPRIVYNYDFNRPDPRYRGYYANRYYRGGNGYTAIRVTRQTRIYRGDDDRYYCRRNDGTTGLIVGAALGGVLGSKLNRGRSDVLGTLLGVGAGAAIGQAIDRGNVQCR